MDEIYRTIPDFGGFVVKANSEGQPGPQDYGRSHADGANMLADAVAPHGGIIMWRAFVYSHEQPDDRAKQAYSEFVPLDGKFRENVLLQVKNGAIDFQPREPFHPLFGAMPPHASDAGAAAHQGISRASPRISRISRPCSKRCSRRTPSRRAQARRSRRSSTAHFTGMGGLAWRAVANIGADRNWTGSQFDQANWYAFGRLAWNPSLGSRAIAEEWLRMTFSNESEVHRARW